MAGDAFAQACIHKVPLLAARVVSASSHKRMSGLPRFCQERQTCQLILRGIFFMFITEQQQIRLTRRCSDGDHSNEYCSVAPQCIPDQACFQLTRWMLCVVQSISDQTLWAAVLLAQVLQVACGMHRTLLFAAKGDGGTCSPSVDSRAAGAGIASCL